MTEYITVPAVIQAVISQALSIGVQNYMKSGVAKVDEDELRGFLANG